MATYAQLTTLLQDYVENSFTVDQLASFFEQAEQRIYNTVQLPALRKNVTGSTTTGNKYISCPDDFLSVFSIAVVDGSGDYVYLLNKDVNFIREAYPNASTTGVPKYYSLFGPQSANDKELTIIVGPTPAAAYPIELHYFYYPTSIVTAGQTWLGDNFDSALLYGAIVEAYVFMKGEPDMIATYKARYDEALSLLKLLGDGKERGDAYRDGQVKLKVI
jgi:hypothetical protein